MCHCTTHRRAVASSKMMVIGPMLPSDLQCIPSSKMILLPYLPVNNVKSGCYFHRQQTNMGMGQFDFELSHRTNITNLNNKYRLFSRRKVLDQFYTPMRKTRKLLSKLYASQPLKMKLDENQSSQEYSKENAEDYVSRLLRERPSQVEPKFLIGDELYTLREREQLKTSFGKRINEALNVIISKLASKDTQETGRREEKQYGIYGGETDKDGQPKPVFLKELLRQYKGELYVPEEVFKFHASEVDEFNRNLETLPEMLLEDFLKAMRANQIEMLTSRAVQTPQGNYLYRDFVIDLKDIPGDRSLQRKKWAMHLSEAEAQAVLGEYSGPQREIERLLTPYVVPPPVMPHPVASSISSRVMLELAMVTSVVTAAAFAVGGLLSAMIFTVTSLVTIIAIRVIWPLTLPLLKSLALLFVNFGKVIWEILTGAGRKGGLFGYLSDVYNYFASGGLYSTLQTGGPVLFVLITMVVLIKFTLTRRPKDFRKWDIWQAIEFGQSKPQARVEGSTGVTFSDVAGIDEVVGELQELVKYLKNPELFNKMGTKPPHGVLLEGPPGCGKTLVAKAIAGEAGVPFYQMAGSEFVEVLVGVGAARVRDLFKRAKVNKPSVVFIDEIDALGAMRHGISGQSNMENYDAGAQERETTLNQLLIELDGFDTGQGVIFLGATNRMDLLDPALLRPGRFDRKIAVRPPAEKGRLDILKVHAKKVKLSPSVDLSVYAKNLPGWSGAELAQLLQEAALMAVRHGHDSIIQSDMDQAVDRLTMGPERIGVESHSPTLWQRATGEVGTALVSHLLRRLENAQVESCDRISIIPRGETLSRTIFNRLDDEAYLFERRPQLLHRMQVMLGGRAAEEVMYGHNTSTVSLSYLPDASWLACKIISVWNLENPMTIHGEPASWKRSPSFTGPPLHFEGSLYEDYGLHEKSLNYNLDNDVALRTEKLVHDMYKHTLTLIQRYHAALAKSIYVVMEKREIKGDDLDLIIDWYPADTPVHLVEEEENPGSLPKGVEFQQVLPSEASDSSNVSWEKTAQEEQLRSKTI